MHHRGPQFAFDDRRFRTTNRLFVAFSLPLSHSLTFFSLSRNLSEVWNLFASDFRFRCSVVADKDLGNNDWHDGLNWNFFENKIKLYEILGNTIRTPFIFLTLRQFSFSIAISLEFLYLSTMCNSECLRLFNAWKRRKNLRIGGDQKV